MTKILVGAIFCMVSSWAFAWGQEGHSAVAEIAQRRLSPQAAERVADLLGKGVSLASVSSWADDVRSERPQTYNWHFVDIPASSNEYNASRDCKKEEAKGDCVVAELQRLRNDLRCGETVEEKQEALKWAIHFVGDIHQPFHAVGDSKGKDLEKGGNLVSVIVTAKGKDSAPPTHGTTMNLHALWDEGLIKKTVWSWGALVIRVEKTLDNGVETSLSDDPVVWATETHIVAQSVWNRTKSQPKNGADYVIDESYWSDMEPVAERQIGVAGLRLARFLNAAYENSTCPMK
jgi:lysozyme family protein